MTKLRLLSYIIMAYMIVALGWWAILLYQQNKENYNNKRALYELKGISISELNSLEKEYNRQIFMIAGEAAVFMISLLLGLWFIQRGYKRQIESSEEKSNFLLSVTHELKSPVSSIQLALETIEKRELSKNQQSLLIENATEDIKRLDKLTNNLLLAASTEASFILNKEEFNLHPQMVDIIDELKDKYPSHKFKFLEPVKIPLILADKQGVRSIFYNLIENAAKYSKDDSTICIDYKVYGKFIEVLVIDEGIGISKEHYRRVFERFYRIGSEETRKTKGTGLGLYIVNRLVHAHQWKIKIMANKEQGTIFLVTIPEP